MRDRGILRELFVGRWGTPLPWTRVAIYIAVFVVLIALAKASMFHVVAPHISEDDHGMLSLNIAVNRAFCGAVSSVSTLDPRGKALFSEESTSEQPVAQIVNARWGSMERYCATVTRPFVINENSLMLVESVVWRVAPGLSLIGVGRVLLAVKAGLILFFGVVLLRLGAGVILCYAAVDAAFALLEKLQLNYAFANYSFLLCVVMATIALYPLMLSLPTRSRARLMAWPAIAGLWSAFVVNMRTSYLPLCIGVALLYACALMVEPSDAVLRRVQRLRHVATAVVFFAIGYAVFQYSFIPQNRAVGSDNLSHHMFFHPLVLSIGLPENAFSHREGIEWDDAVGLTLAHKVNPSAIYLTKEYEQALETYYFDLWKRYPAEMRSVYLEKAKLAATEMMELTDVPDPGVNFARRLLRRLPNGLWLLSLLVGFTIVSVWQYLRKRAPILLLTTLMGTAATMLMLESMLIVPRYFVTYHAPLLWLYCTVTFIVFQLAFTAIARVHPLDAGGVAPSVREIH
jgi:hypothetical protein